MTDYTKGGKGKCAPYKTVHYRIPEGIKFLVMQIAAVYKRLYDSNDDPQGIQFIDSLHQAIAKITYPDFKPDTNFKTREEAIKLANKILNQKKSAKISMAKLISEIYNDEVKPEDLK